VEQQGRCRQEPAPPAGARCLLWERCDEEVSPTRSPSAPTPSTTGAHVFTIKPASQGLQTQEGVRMGVGVGVGVRVRVRVRDRARV